MRVWYFAFGSNMNPARLAGRGVRWTQRERGVLPGWTLSFAKMSGQPGVGYATIERDRRCLVEGILYRTDTASLAILDQYEGVPMHYAPTEMEIERDGRRSVVAEVYIATRRMTKSGLLPTATYLDHLLAGRDLLSQTYVAWLKTCTTVEDARVKHRASLANQLLLPF